MGAGIAQVAIQSGFNSILYDVNEAMLPNAKISIEKNLQLLLEKNRINKAENNASLQRLRLTGDIGACVADLVIEAVVEKPEIKVKLFNQLAAVNNPDCIFATNTSSLSVTAIAEKTNHPERVVGMHFFNPAPLMKLVEIVRTDYSSEAAISTVFALAKKMNKIPVLCRDAPGFIVNHVARPYYLEALKLLEEGIADIETIDQLMEASGFKMGPFRLMDLIGNDVNLAVSSSVYEAMQRPPRLQPSPIQQQKVSAGQLGRKTGRGYYDYHTTKK